MRPQAWLGLVASQIFKRGTHITRTAYSDRIAKQWNRVTGHYGGALKRYALVERILSHIETLDGRVVLELGAGNGYFTHLLLRRFSGQPLQRLIISDQTQALLFDCHLPVSLGQDGRQSAP